jgi:phosphate transport system substrate-binding protein
MKKIIISLVACAALAAGISACGGDDSSSSGNGGSSGGGSGVSGQVSGAGSSAQEAAMEAWIAGLQDKNPDATAAYDPVGSGGGREQFLGGGADFAGSDAAFDETELPKAAKRCGGADKVIEIPDYISAIAVVYNLDGVDKLQLSPDTVAKIFDQKIKTWDDPAIKADNPGVQLPSDRITPVNRSDDSGTTENFTDYLSKAAPDAWTHEVSDVWPVKGGEAAEGTSGVVEAVTNGKGAIGYADESQAGDLGVAALKVGDKYAKPSPDAAAKVLDHSKKDTKLSKGKYVLAYDLNRETKGTYPNVLVSYLIGCTKYDSADKGKLVNALFGYIISPEGQDAAAKNAGSAPLSDTLRQQVQPAVDAIGG